MKNKLIAVLIFDVVLFLSYRAMLIHIMHPLGH